MKFKRSSFLVKLLILVLVIYAAVTLVSLQNQVKDKRAESAELRQSITSMEQENQRLEDAIDTIGTDVGIRRVASSKLGLEEPGVIEFRDVGR